MAFDKQETNALPELAELRLELTAREEDLDLHCQTRFAVTEIEFRKRTYQVGLKEARLQLYLEGWETKLGLDFGDAEMPVVEVTSEVVGTSGVKGGAKAGVSESLIPAGNVSLEGSKEVVRKQTEKSTVQRLPVVALPNNAWKIQSPDISKEAPLDGTAMSGERLCVLSTKEGSNRRRLNAELQVRGSQFFVQPAKGNKLGKRFSLLRNKDAIVAKVLEKALTREASTSTSRGTRNTVVVSKVDLEPK